LHEPLKLMAQDDEDLSVVAATLQDAIVRVGDTIYQPKERRFAAVLNRFCWEDCSVAQRVAGKSPFRRVLSGIHFDGVLGVKSQGIRLDRKDAVLELLTVLYDPKDDGAGTVTLVFSGNGAIRLEVECIDVSMRDLGKPWKAQSMPEHGVEADDQ